MEFEELWEKVWMHCKLPNTAKEQLPVSLSNRMKELLLKSRKSPSDIAQIIQKAVDDINGGSTETLDLSVRKRL